MSKVQLRSEDGELFEVDEAIAFTMEPVKNMLEDTGYDFPVPLPNVTASIFAKVIEFVKYHLDAAKTDEDGNPIKTAEEIEAWNAGFFNANEDVLCDLIMAANYLNVKELLDRTSQAVANILKEKTVEEIRAVFNIRNDFTAEEEEKIRRENSWSFE